MKIGIVAALLLLLGSFAAEAADYGFRFGEKRQGVLVPTRTLKMCVKATGYRWGYDMNLPPGDHKITVGIVAPAPPQIISSKPNSSGSSQFTFDEGMHSGHYDGADWKFDEGDPVGNWTMQVFVDGALAATFNFTVAAAKSCP